MKRVRLSTPLSEGDVRPLSVGDVVYISGTVVTLRDLGHRRALELLRRGGSLPIDLRGLAVFHAGPVVRRVGGRFEIVAIGPTTSARMEPLEPEFIELTGVRMIIGKGGMGRGTAEACRRFGAVYVELVGGTASLITRSVRRVREVHWLDLGVPEAMWVLEVEDMGPAIVSIDAEGRNIHEPVMEKARSVLEELLQGFSEKPSS